MNELLRDDDDRREDTLDMQLEQMMADQKSADFHMLRRVDRGETDHRDFLYLVGRLQYNLNDLENNHD